jgi:hypothetical protein
VKQIIPRGHIEIVRNIKKAKEYCMKSETATGQHWERGYIYKEPKKKIVLSEEDQKICDDILESDERIHIMAKDRLLAVRWLCENHNAVYVTGDESGRKGIYNFVKKEGNMSICIVYTKKQEAWRFEDEIKAGIMYVGGTHNQMVTFDTKKIIYLQGHT